jgi:hypothetical protein
MPAAAGMCIKKEDHVGNQIADLEGHQRMWWGISFREKVRNVKVWSLLPTYLQRPSGGRMTRYTPALRATTVLPSSSSREHGIKKG